VLRIEDLDTPRVKPGVIDLTIDLLSWLGMDWDEGPHIQSSDLSPYREAMQTLASRARVYPSSLTRTQIESAASAPQEGSHEVLFPASLRPSQTPSTFDDSAPSWRVIVPDEPVEFEDAFAGPQRQFPSRTIGDFVVWTRRDPAGTAGPPARPGQPAYQLAVVVDDHRQGITQVVRGDDLLDSAARQLLIYRALSLAPEPAYTHLPLVRGADGRRLAKRHGDTRLDTYRLRGVGPERVIGLIGHWSGVPGPRRPMSAMEFRQGFDIRTMSKEPVTFTAEDDAWLASS
jgi:glutamyl-tRNA synthetase